MLSATNSVTDVKARLAETYEDFNFRSNTDFEAAIAIALADVQLLFMYPVIGSAAYTIIAAKDKVSLSEKETNLYWAEVYYACSEFIEKRKVIYSTPSGTSSSEKLTVEGYTYESRSSSRESKAEKMNIAITEFYGKALQFMGLAGWNPHQLQRGGGAFGSPTNNFVYTDVV